jgi:uncharacterized protein YneR
MAIELGFFVKYGGGLAEHQTFEIRLGANAPKNGIHRKHRKSGDGICDARIRAALYRLALGWH